MFIEIEAVTVTTHENPRNGDRIEDQRHTTSLRIDLAQLAGLLRPLAEMIFSPAASGGPRETPAARNGNGAYHTPARR